MTDLAELRAIAEKATPGPFKTQFSRHQVADLSPPPAPHPTRGRG